MNSNWLNKVIQGLGSQDQDQQKSDIGIAGTWLAQAHPPGIKRNNQPIVGYSPTFHGRPMMVSQNPDL